MKEELRYVRFCAWGGPVLLGALILFWGLMGHNIPPYGSDLPASAIADHFRNHTTSARVGMILTISFGVFYLIWGVGVSKVMEAIRPGNDVLSRLQTWGAGFTTLVIVIPACMWLTAAFRPNELDPQIIQLLYDMGWILFDVQYSLTALQVLAMGICFLDDRRPIPIIPKWVSWYIIWVGCMLPLLALIAMAKSGPFSRNGLINYWIEFPIFFLFMLLASIYTIRAIPKLEAEEGARGG